MSAELQDNQGNERCPIDTLIANLLNERQQMLALFCKLAGLEPFTHDKPISSELQDFCEILMDYLSAGHFEAYERILEEDSPNHHAVVETVQKVYPAILKTTDAALDFNDKYDNRAKGQRIDELSTDLSQLISDLALRIDLEDRIINTLRGAKGLN